MYFKRKIEEKIRTQFDNEQAIIVTGMRRSGKTTLLRKLYNDLSNNKVWFDFENPLDVKQFEDIDYNDIYQNIINVGRLDEHRRIYVFVDEVQFFPEISKIVKYLIDHYKIKFILTGSASYYLKNLFPESLAGRKILFELFPLDFEEFLTFRQADVRTFKKLQRKTAIKEVEYELFDKLYEEFLTWGGFPRVVLEKDVQQKELLLKDIFSSYFQKEILALADYKKNAKVRDLILLLAPRVGSQLDLVKISQELQITRTTVYSYLSFLQATYFIHLLSPFSKSVDREVSGMQKIYFCDNGILKIMANLNDGQFLENAIYNQLHHHGQLNYYRTKNGGEIDFIVDKKQAYEVKTTATPSDVVNLNRKTATLKLINGYLISKNWLPNFEQTILGQFI
ncbi:MAG: hypothetical protein A2233_03475 [Candidatus Kerfeldbacteria bacterium RIFOXYA2_FULL_38_24]|uniref:ATPase n=1 Tax=Candidatus Kerfeldbacteria bacterium RIFOXYB2_FULL_38_14 TaxID=1798547 RepID=A0A1G2BEM8_9BACT|nr:MAG: hypothetical protein A2233_03475 [Candidatus Kerfeldbacteria bacterium RIFOXYA2_FULL_38_24]OGY87495.1 MAG: hypothetical protein A2319_03970 [Candidatus Kerfeldbacteria bacterium RIFOXYB2_FULL_38_14]OGY90231.1 MAG: hypothetical protein A2458_03660 [Candidatus Kerfeldbacteria bacterium RIFOXYC2_FULL_38_9]